MRGHTSPKKLDRNVTALIDKDVHDVHTILTQAIETPEIRNRWFDEGPVEATHTVGFSAEKVVHELEDMVDDFGGYLKDTKYDMAYKSALDLWESLSAVPDFVLQDLKEPLNHMLGLMPIEQRTKLMDSLKMEGPTGIIEIPH